MNCSHFNKNSCRIDIKVNDWQLPIQAITSITIIEDGKNKKLALKIFSDQKLQSRLMELYNQKKQASGERIIEFPLYKRTTARDFIWHVKRIHHWWQ